MKAMRIRLSVIGLVMMAGYSCHAVSTGNPEAVKHEPAQGQVETGRGNASIEVEMQQLVEGDPMLDAKRALDAGDKRLWGYYKRGELVLPGVQGVHQETDPRVAPGMGDVIYGQRHKDLRKQVLEYIQHYNEYISNNR